MQSSWPVVLESAFGLSHGNVGPKPLLDPFGNKSLLDLCLKRAAAFTTRDRTWLVCAEGHAASMRRAADLPRGHVWAEPRGRDTAMAIGYAASRVAAFDPEATMAVLPADHLIPDRRAFAKAIRRAAQAASGAERLVTLGVRPTRAETGYGYLEVGPPVGRSFPGLRRVRRFVEKPNLGRARRFAASGRHLWNAGIFVWKARIVLEEIESHAPAIHKALRGIQRRPSGPGSRGARESAYRRAPRISVDHGVLERSGRVWTLPVHFEWSDVGNWAALAQSLGVKAGASRVVAGNALLEDSDANLVWAGKRLVAMFGVRDLAVIDTDDALLVASLDRCGDLKHLVGRVRRSHGKALL